MAEGKDEAGRFIPGNQFWKARSRHGDKPTFATAEQLREACEDYFEWSDANPLHEAKAFSFEGKVTITALPKMRAMTMVALWMFIGTTKQSWSEWRANRADLADVIEWVEAVVYRQKFEGAAADLLNASIIARDLGLADKKTVEGPGKDGSHIVETRDATPQEVARRLAFMLTAAVEDSEK